MNQSGNTLPMDTCPRTVLITVLFMMLMMFPLLPAAQDCDDWLEFVEEIEGFPSRTVLIPIDNIQKLVKQSPPMKYHRIDYCELSSGSGMKNCGRFDTNTDFDYMKRVVTCKVSREGVGPP